MAFVESSRKIVLWLKQTSNSESVQKIIMSSRKISSWHALGAEIQNVSGKN